MEINVGVMWAVAIFSFVAGGLFFYIFSRRRHRFKFQAAEAVREKDETLRDAITGLYNREHLLERLHEQMARCARQKERMALVLWDIDGFVNFNNQYGQREGDRLLKKVGETIRASLRRGDEAFRSGADDFSALLIPADDSIAAEVTRRVNNTVSTDLFKEDEAFAGRTFSISSGVVFFPGDHNSPEALLHAAGQALYASAHPVRPKGK